MNSLSRSIGSRLGSRFVLKIRCLSGFAFLCIAFAYALGCGKNEIKRAENSKADRSRPVEVSVAAEAAMKHFGVYDRLRDRLVLGENIAQTAQFVETGAADIGVLALALALSPEMRDKGRFWIVPLDAYPSLEQGGVILSWVRDWEAASAFRSFVLSDQGENF